MVAVTLRLLDLHVTSVDAITTCDGDIWIDSGARGDHEEAAVPPRGRVQAGNGDLTSSVGRPAEVVHTTSEYFNIGLPSHHTSSHPLRSLLILLRRRRHHPRPRSPLLAPYCR
ncbi:hypothetical protein E2562_019697 [Oryza meyeriana var. granulata]|uniref:Uncharacterized protein n=1 Tax=Oryza meyeriana var. granulata TaxID=110450 RepID=A0A6G1C8U9_9ORYZ|nr:hypothetical protein E2562_019697 [Oryza meyeriana var. granulata]